MHNKVVIGDAEHIQRQTSKQIGKAGGNYLWTVKGNQPQLLQDLKDWFDPNVPIIPGMGCLPKEFQSATLTTSSQLNDFLDWPFRQQVFQLQGTITLSKTRQTRYETVYGITS